MSVNAYMYIKGFIIGIWPYAIVGAGWTVSVRLLSLHLMLELEVCRAGNREGKMDVKCGRPRTHWRPQARAGNHEDGLEPMSVSHHLQLRWCGCPAEEAGALHHRVKYASGPGIREAEGSSWGRWSSCRPGYRPDCCPEPTRWASR